jgi:aldehyde dehydrogenase (NAD+)
MAGARVLVGGRTAAAERFVAPTLLTDVPLTAEVMTQEIFGPVLPVFKFKHVDEALEVIRNREKPLALYIYSESPTNVGHIMKNTRAGGTCVNHSGVHFFNNDLPFGGSNHSGLGKSHGFYGFQAFSNQRGVLHQWAPFSAIELMMPPYGRLKQKLIDLTIRFF